MTYPLTSYWEGTSLAVASIFAMTMFGLSESCEKDHIYETVFTSIFQSDRYNTQDLKTHLLSKFFVFRLQALAVSTPGGVKLDENVFAVIIYNWVKVLSHKNLE